MGVSPWRCWPEKDGKSAATNRSQSCIKFHGSVFIFLQATVCNIVCVTISGINGWLPNSLCDQTLVNKDLSLTQTTRVNCTKGSLPPSEPVGDGAGGSTELPGHLCVAGTVSAQSRFPLDPDVGVPVLLTARSCDPSIRTVSETSLTLKSSSAPSGWDFASRCLS